MAEEIKEEIPQSPENFSIKRKKPWLMVILLIITMGAIIFFVYQNYQLKQQLSNLNSKLLAQIEKDQNITEDAKIDCCKFATPLLDSFRDIDCSGRSYKKLPKIAIAIASTARSNLNTITITIDIQHIGGSPGVDSIQIAAEDFNIIDENGKEGLLLTDYISNTDLRDINNPPEIRNIPKKSDRVFLTPGLRITGQITFSIEDFDSQGSDYFKLIYSPPHTLEKAIFELVTKMPVAG